MNSILFFVAATASYTTTVDRQSPQTLTYTVGLHLSIMPVTFPHTLPLAMTAMNSSARATWVDGILHQQSGRQLLPVKADR
jgi:hypothetical protein